MSVLGMCLGAAAVLAVPVLLLLKRNGWHLSEPVEVPSLVPGDQPGSARVLGDAVAIQLYPYVKVEEDGSARELSPSEREYLETPFHPADGGRP